MGWQQGIKPRLSGHTIKASNFVQLILLSSWDGSWRIAIHLWQQVEFWMRNRPHWWHQIPHVFPKFCIWWLGFFCKIPFPPDCTILLLNVFKWLWHVCVVLDLLHFNQDYFNSVTNKGIIYSYLLFRCFFQPAAAWQFWLQNDNQPPALLNCVISYADHSYKLKNATKRFVHCLKQTLSHK